MFVKSLRGLVRVKSLDLAARRRADAELQLARPLVFVRGGRRAERRVRRGRERVLEHLRCHEASRSRLGACLAQPPAGHGAGAVLCSLRPRRRGGAGRRRPLDRAAKGFLVSRRGRHVRGVADLREGRGVSD